MNRDLQEKTSTDTYANIHINTDKDAHTPTHTNIQWSPANTRKLFYCLLVGEGRRDTGIFVYENPQRILVSAGQKDVHSRSYTSSS